MCRIEIVDNSLQFANVSKFILQRHLQKRLCRSSERDFCLCSNRNYSRGISLAGSGTWMHRKRRKVWCFASTAPFFDFRRVCNFLQKPSNSSRSPGVALSPLFLELLVDLLFPSHFATMACVVFLSFSFEVRSAIAGRKRKKKGEEGFRYLVRGSALQDADVALTSGWHSLTQRK